LSRGILSRGIPGRRVSTSDGPGFLSRALQITVIDSISGSTAPPRGLQPSLAPADVQHSSRGREHPLGTGILCASVRAMRFRMLVSSGLGIVTAHAVAAVAVCASGCSSLDSVNYGPSDGLKGEMPPPAVLGDSGEGVDSSDDGSSDATITPMDAGPPCAVSWATDVFPKMMSTGTWRCADSSCHGGFQSPKMSDDSSATYNSLASYRMVIAPQHLLYILTGSTDPTQSGIECNLSGTSCGNRMPIVTNGAQLPTAQDIMTLDTWVRCGSPKN
jgi:hypothetical protein